MPKNHKTSNGLTTRHLELARTSAKRIALTGNHGPEKQMRQARLGTDDRTILDVIYKGARLGYVSKAELAWANQDDTITEPVPERTSGAQVHRDRATDILATTVPGTTTDPRSARAQARVHAILADSLEQGRAADALERIADALETISRKLG